MEKYLVIYVANKFDDVQRRNTKELDIFLKVLVEIASDKTSEIDG